MPGGGSRCQPPCRAVGAELLRRRVSPVWVVSVRETTAYLPLMGRLTRYRTIMRVTTA